MYQHPNKPEQTQETEAPFAVYLETAKDQVARSVEDGFLSGHRSAEIARALAVMNRDADRAERKTLKLNFGDRRAA